jgi:hypothetical protein
MMQVIDSPLYNYGRTDEKQPQKIALVQFQLLLCIRIWESTDMYCCLPLGFVGTSSCTKHRYLLPKNPLYFEQGFSPLNTNKLVAHMEFHHQSGGQPTLRPEHPQRQSFNQLSIHRPITWSNHWQTGLPIYENQASFFTLYAVSTSKVSHRSTRCIRAMVRSRFASRTAISMYRCSLQSSIL